MKRNIIRVDVQGNECRDGDWWTCLALCNKCEKVIHDEDVMFSEKPSEDDVDFCYDCLRDLVDSGMSIAEIEKKYKKS